MVELEFISVYVCTYEICNSLVMQKSYRPWGQKYAFPIFFPVPCCQWKKKTLFSDHLVRVLFWDCQFVIWLSKYHRALLPVTQGGHFSHLPFNACQFPLYNFYCISLPPILAATKVLFQSLIGLSPSFLHCHEKKNLGDRFYSRVDEKAAPQITLLEPNSCDSP